MYVRLNISEIYHIIYYINPEHRVHSAHLLHEYARGQMSPHGSPAILPAGPAREDAQRRLPCGQGTRLRVESDRRTEWSLVRASVDPTNGTSLSESLYSFWVYGEILGHDVKVRTTEQAFIKPKSS